MLDTGPAVAITGGPATPSRTHVTLPVFDGPLALLLALIEARQLDVLTVPLGALAGAYLDALATLDADRMGNVSAFIAIAGQLILIKSRALLPRRGPDIPGVLADEGLDPEAELRARLIEYRAFRHAGSAMLEAATRTIGLFHREQAVSRAAGLAGAAPAAAAPMDPAVLVAALEGIARLAPPPPQPPETMRRSVTLTDRAQLIRQALAGAPVVVLQDLLAGVGDRVVIAVTFLAMLELVKRREIVVEQADPFGPILARRMSAAERVAAGLSATVDDDMPLDETLEDFA